MKRILIICLFLLAFKCPAFALDLDLKGMAETSDKHFKVYYKFADAEAARGILNKAENYYSSIADNIGYARYQNFWTWEQRVPIVYFSSKEEYVRVTGQPEWSRGFSVSHLASVNFRLIVTYKGQADFLTSTLPHEISHLILHDFIGPNRKIPLWFDEGVAQQNEAKGEEGHRRLIARLIAANQSMPLSVLQNIHSETDLDLRYASIFYAESLYIVDFLIKTYGKEDFISLCRNLRDGKSFEEALRSAYYPALDSMQKLQDAWVKHMLQYL